MKFPTRRIMPRAQVAFRKAFTALLLDAAGRVQQIVVTGAGADGVIDTREAEKITAQAAQIMRAVFVDSEGRSIGADGTPYSPYARLLLAAIAWETAETVAVHGRVLRDNLPDDVVTWATTNTRRAVEAHKRRRVLLDITNGGGRYAELTSDEIRAKYAPLKLVAENPLKQYDAAHTWVDPNGYTLSERIWRADTDMRAKLNAMLRDEIRSGTGALQLSRKLEQFLVPGRAKLRTNKPYGTDASYAAMRLARSEIARAGNAAVQAASATNPFVQGIDVARSAGGDPSCLICPQHATLGIGGERLRDPYPVGGANVGPYHPHCMCYAISAQITSVTDTVAALREMMGDADAAGLTPVASPLVANQFTQQLLGAAVFALLPQVADLLGLTE